MFEYDWLVIGSGPAGEKGAVQAAYFGKRVAVIEKQKAVGGACVNTGTLPSKTLRETSIYLSGWRQRDMYGGMSVKLKEGVSVPELMCRQEPVLGTERARIRKNLERHKVDLIEGEARFVGEHTIEVLTPEGPKRLTSDAVLLAVGSSPFRPAFVPFEDPNVDDADSILRLDKIPKAMVILGGGVIGCEYASIFAALGTKCMVVEGRDQILGFLDLEVNKILSEQMTRLGVEIVLKKNVVDVSRKAGVLTCTLDDGRVMECERLLFAGGRSGNTHSLGLETVGITPDSRGLLKCNPFYQVEGAKGGRIYATGDVIGFPALASVAMEQGRVAACHAFDIRYKTKVSSSFPYGLYTIPEVSMIGETEESAAKKGISFEVGKAFYRDNARGQIVGDTEGMVKLIFQTDDRKLIGCHIVGERATELIHTAQALIHFGGTLDDFIDQVFNFPTLGEMFKYAAYDGLGRLQRRQGQAAGAQKILG